MDDGYLIFTEYQEAPNGMFVAEGALWWDDKPLPLMLNGVVGDPGYIAGNTIWVKRDGRNIWMDAALVGRYSQFDLKDFDLSAYCTELMVEDNIITSARLRAISIYPKGGIVL